MKTRLLLALTALTCFAGTLHAKTAIQEARDRLEHALSLLNKKDEGIKTKRKASIPNILSVLGNAEVRLSEVKNNKGTNTNVALKFIADAKAELEAAKVTEADHFQKARTAVEEALKRVRQSIQISKS